jgi:hypothetical protein
MGACTETIRALIKAQEAKSTISKDVIFKLSQFTYIHLLPQVQTVYSCQPCQRFWTLLTKEIKGKVQTKTQVAAAAPAQAPKVPRPWGKLQSRSFYLPK